MSVNTYQSGSGINPWQVLGFLLLAAILCVGIVALQENAIYLLIATMLFVAFVHVPVLGLYATTLLLLLSGSQGILGSVQEGAIAVTLSRLCGTAALGAWLINILARKISFQLNAPAIWLCVYCAWALFSTVMSLEVGELFPEWFRLVTLLGFFLLAVNTLNTPRKLHIYVVILVFSGMVMSLVAVIQVVTPQLQVAGIEAWRTLGSADVAFIDQESLQGEAAIRASGTAGHSNWLAMALLLILPLNAYWWKVCNNWRCKTFILMSTALEVLALVFTYTRTGLVIGVVLGLLLLFKQLVRMTPLRVCAFLLALIAAWLALPQPYKERVLNPKQYTESRSVQSRFELQEAAAEYAIANPVFGLGTGGFGTEFVRENNRTARTMKYFVDYAGWQAVFIGTHNMYLQIASDTGFVGLFFFICFYVLTVRGVMRAEDRFRQDGDVWGETLCASLFVSLIGFALVAVFLHALTQKIWWMITAAAIVIPLYNMHFKDVVGVFGRPRHPQPRRRNA